MRKSIILLMSITSLSMLSINEGMAQDRTSNVNKVNDPVKPLGYEKKLRWAEGLYKDGSYQNAVDYYGELMMEQPRNPYLAYQMAKSYSYLRDYKLAAKMYGYAYDLAKELYPLAIYDEAVMLKMDGNYTKSRERFNQFINMNKRDVPQSIVKEYKKWRKRAILEVEGIDMGIEAMANPVAATVKNVGPNVNTGYTQSSPMPLGDTALLYGTQNITQLSVSSKSVKSKEYLSKLMVSRKQKYTNIVDTFEWPLEFEDGNFNSGNYHVSNGVFSSGGERFYFTRCQEADSNKMMCKIFVSVFEKDRWGSATELGENINIDGTSSTNPFIAKVKKQEVLFFASNREMQSRGGYDLWYSVYDTRQKTYRRPQNAGKQINTAGDEKTPYYDSRTGTLYFASNGWKSLGGFDIYSAEGGPSRYRANSEGKYVTNLGFPINTTYDDMYFILDPSGKPDGYVVSNRPGSYSVKNPTCCDDIWRIQYEPKITVNGVILNAKTQQPVRDVAVKMVNDAGNVDTFHTEDGKFRFYGERNHTYVLSGDKESFSSKRAQFSTMGMKRDDADRVVDIVIYMDSFSLNDTFEMKNVYYDFNKATLRPESGQELELLITLMNEAPSIDVQIVSHTDNVGSASYNLQLSNDRAQSVVDYLVSSGIDRSRLSTLGKGFTEPAAGNNTEAERQLNRRTEFKIVADHPSRRIVYDSGKKGNLGQQSSLMLGNGDQVDENFDNSGYPDEEVEIKK